MNSLDMKLFELTFDFKEIEVDYAKPIEMLREECGYPESLDLTTENFRQERFFGPEKGVVTLMQSARALSQREILFIFARWRLTWLNAHEMLSLGKQCFQELRRGPVVSFGAAVIENNGEEKYLCLTNRGDKQLCADFLEKSRIYGPWFRFAGIRR